jgi:Helix-turn-helix domain
MLPGTARFDGMTLPPGRTIGVLSVHEARHALGQWLRELRQQAGLTGRQVADLLSWPASKASKLENGRQTPTDDDVRGWASVTHARCCRWACPSWPTGSAFWTTKSAPWAKGLSQILRPTPPSHHWPAALIFSSKSSPRHRVT